MSTTPAVRTCRLFSYLSLGTQPLLHVLASSGRRSLGAASAEAPYGVQLYSARPSQRGRVEPIDIPRIGSLLPEMDDALSGS